MKLDLLTNATVVEDAIRFAATSEYEKSKGKVKLSSNISDEDDKESRNLIMTKSLIKKAKKNKKRNLEK